jgi:hypothetical protein
MNQSALQVYLLRVINGEESGLAAGLARIFLSGLEFIYWFLSRLQFRMIRRHKLPVPVLRSAISLPGAPVKHLPLFGW